MWVADQREPLTLEHNEQWQQPYLSALSVFTWLPSDLIKLVVQYLPARRYHHVPLQHIRIRLRRRHVYTLRFLTNLSGTAALEAETPFPTSGLIRRSSASNVLQIGVAWPFCATDSRYEYVSYEDDMLLDHALFDVHLQERPVYTRINRVWGESLLTQVGRWLLDVARGVRAYLCPSGGGRTPRFHQRLFDSRDSELEEALHWRHLAALRAQYQRQLRDNLATADRTTLTFSNPEPLIGHVCTPAPSFVWGHSKDIWIEVQNRELTSDSFWWKGVRAPVLQDCVEMTVMRVRLTLTAPGVLEDCFYPYNAVLAWQRMRLRPVDSFHLYTPCGRRTPDLVMLLLTLGSLLLDAGVAVLRIAGLLAFLLLVVPLAWSADAWSHYRQQSAGQYRRVALHDNSDDDGDSDDGANLRRKDTDHSDNDGTRHSHRHTRSGNGNGNGNPSRSPSHSDHVHVRARWLQLLMHTWLVRPWIVVPGERR